MESIETVRKLCNMGIYILFEKENIDTGKMEGELLLSILSSLAESESRSISENETWSIQKRFRNGTYKIAYPPYGYDYIDGEMVVNPEQSEIVKWIFEEVLSGSSTTQIAKELNARGISTKRGGRWTGHTINGMIKNEKYTEMLSSRRPAPMIPLPATGTTVKETSSSHRDITRPSSAMRTLMPLTTWSQGMPPKKACTLTAGSTRTDTHFRARSSAETAERCGNAEKSEITSVMSAPPTWMIKMLVP